MNINIQRLNADLNRYAEYGKDSQGGITRPSFSRDDLAVRDMLIQDLKALGMEVYVDAAANIWGKLKGNGKKVGSIVIGSHLDTVKNGGKYDGALGVLMAKELAASLRDGNVVLDHDLEIVSFTAEESNDFRLSTMGSRAFVGRLSREELEHAEDSNGVKLTDALRTAGGDLARYGEMERMRAGKTVFLELHIEQGVRLENAGVALAVVDRAAGIYRNLVTLLGEANHSGTTAMERRADALAAASQLVLDVEKVCKSLNGLVGTVGHIRVQPNTVNTIPGKVELTVELRGTDERQMNEAIAALNRKLNDISLERGIAVKQDVMLFQPPEYLDAEIVSLLEHTARQIGEPCLTLASMAIHDAVHLSAVCKSAMVFVRSVGGISHSPREYSASEDIEKAGNLLLNGILNIDRALASAEDSLAGSKKIIDVFRS